MRNSQEQEWGRKTSARNDRMRDACKAAGREQGKIRTWTMHHHLESDLERPSEWGHSGESQDMETGYSVPAGGRGTEAVE